MNKRKILIGLGILILLLVVLTIFFNNNSDDEILETNDKLIITSANLVIDFKPAIINSDTRYYRGELLKLYVLVDGVKQTSTDGINFGVEIKNSKGEIPNIGNRSMYRNTEVTKTNNSEIYFEATLDSQTLERGEYSLEIIVNEEISNTSITKKIHFTIMEPNTIKIVKNEIEPQSVTMGTNVSISFRARGFVSKEKNIDLLISSRVYNLEGEEFTSIRNDELFYLTESTVEGMKQFDTTFNINTKNWPKETFRIELNAYDGYNKMSSSRSDFLTIE